MRQLEETLILVNQELLLQFHTSISRQIHAALFACVPFIVVSWLAKSSGADEK